MERETNIPKNPSRPINATDTNTTTSSSSSSSFSSSSPLLPHVQAALKRRTMQTNTIRPKRMLVPQRETSRNVTVSVDAPAETRTAKDEVQLNQKYDSKESIWRAENPVTVVRQTVEVASITPPPISSTITKTSDERFNQFPGQRDHLKSLVGCEGDNQMLIPRVDSQYVEDKRKVQFSLSKGSIPQGAADQMATRLDYVSSHMGSLALTEMEWNANNQVEVLGNDDSKHKISQNVETDTSLRSNGAISMLAKRTTVVQDQLHQLRNFLSQPATQSSVVGPSCATTTSVNSTSAPMLNSTTYGCHPNLEGGSHVVAEPIAEFNVNAQHKTFGNTENLSFSSVKDASGTLIDQKVTAAQASTSAPVSQSKDPSHISYKLTLEKVSAHDLADGQSLTSLSKNPSSTVTMEASKSEKQEKVASGKGTSVPRKKGYDPDLFFKVNGKLYQRLGKIGSGGSSEVHKVISSDCKIYALKKIKLKGRDYATAYGFYQEIEYISKLKGKNNIIQLIDYEVTEKTLVREVMNGSTSNKDGRIKDDGCIFMVLEYGEIDLAHMLSQKWKEMDDSNQTIDENWLRFYWQQILQAVNTIHEERIVHSDLKPANFLLVKGSLKLIDFGIAKAIMSDTTNIQRDAQVGTLSYMSPEAFMCNESDENGNTIKCGRPSDIWSLGCILYQMVYGRTPFSEYKTFWAKFKVITDPNHEITYEPVSNPWLLDIMKKCLAWDRNERWRIPQLLQHPFLVPPIPTQPSTPVSETSCKLLQVLTECCASDPDTSNLCRELRQLITDPAASPSLLTSREEQCKLLLRMSTLCFQLHERLAKSGRR